MKLILSAQTQTAVERHALDAHPDECCGLLVGRATASGDREVLEAHPARNLETDRARNRYDLDPRDYLRVERALEGRAGLEIVGVYHSHPDANAVPSRTDADAAWPDQVYLIARASAGAVEDLRAWTFDRQGGTPKEVPVVLQG